MPKIKMKVEKEVTVKSIEVHVKVRDTGNYTLKGDDGSTLKVSEDYVPAFFPGNGGDYLVLDIDLDTGKILNWKIPTEESLKDFIERQA